jgi:PKD repeat protein
MRNYVFCVVAIVCMLTLVLGTQATTILIDPATQGSPPAGGTLTVGVKIEDVTDLYAYQFGLAFDNTALKFSAIEGEEFLGADGATTFPFLTLDGQMVGIGDITPDVVLDVNSAGALMVADVRLGGAGGVDGTGRIVTITFEVLEAKASTLELQDVVLADSDARSITPDVVSGTITPVPNVPPMADAGNDKSARTGEEIHFDGLASIDADGTIVSYSWNFGDGSMADGATVSHVYGDIGSYTVTLTVTDNDGGIGVDTLTVNVLESLPPAIREHSSGSPMLALQATYDDANVHGHTYIDIWQGSMTIEAGQFLEFQVAMFSGNPVFSGTVDLHTSDNSTLRDSGARDQNDVSAHPSADLSQYARDQWYHRKIPLDALAGKTLDGVMIATDSDAHGAGIFRVYVDNIQVTDGESILTAIYIDGDTIPITGTSTAAETAFAGAEGMSDYSVSIVAATPVTPAGKLISSWGSIRSGR